MSKGTRRPTHSVDASGNRLWQRWSAQATVVGTGVALVSLALAVAAPLGWLSPSSSSAHIRPEQLLVLDSNESPRQQIQATVLNTGGTTALIKSASLKVLHVSALPICWSQGDIPLSATYQAVLPRTLSEGVSPVVTVPLHDEARPGGTDRFSISLSVAKGTTTERYATRLYQLAVSIASGSDGRKTRIGVVLVALPYPPDAEQYWTKELATHSQSQLREQFENYLPRVLACYRANTAQLKQALKLNGIRSPYLEKVQTELATPPAASALH
jgi:hypothetical protein